MYTHTPQFNTRGAALMAASFVADATGREQYVVNVAHHFELCEWFEVFTPHAGYQVTDTVYPDGRRIH